MKNEIEKKNISPESLNKISPFQMMISQALEQKCDISVIKEMTELLEKREAKEAKKAFNQSLSGFQSEMKPVKKTAHVHFEKNGKVTDYWHGEHHEAVRQASPLLGKYGLCYQFSQEENNGYLKVTCTLKHIDGHEENYPMIAPIDDSHNLGKIRGRGSTASYLMRYTFQGALGITFEGEDKDEIFTNIKENVFNRNEVISFLVSAVNQQDPVQYFKWLSQQLKRNVKGINELSDKELNWLYNLTQSTH